MSRLREELKWGPTVLAALALVLCLVPFLPFLVLASLLGERP